MEFKQAVVTKQGRELMAKLLNGQSTKFTSIKVSSTVYQDGQLENLTALTNIKQETVVQVYENNTATISAIGAIENTGLQIGYYINTVGLYAMDSDKGEILYSVSSASVNGYMPPDTGVSKSGFNFKIYSEVGNASQVDLTVDPAAVATHADIERLEVHQAWMVGENGEGFANKLVGENLFSGAEQYTENTPFLNDSTKPDGQLIVPSLSAKLSVGSYIFGCETDGIWSPHQPSGSDPNLRKANVYLRGDKSGSSPLFKNANGSIPMAFSIIPGEDEYSWRVRTNTYGNDTFASNVSFWNFKIEQKLPEASEDPINCYPKYVGFGTKTSDNYKNYKWILNPEWSMANTIYGTLNDQITDIQNWIQAHS